VQPTGSAHNPEIPSVSVAKLKKKKPFVQQRDILMIEKQQKAQTELIVHL